jgi:cysteine-rich repeat protein
MGQFDLITAKFTDASALTGSDELAYGDFAPLMPDSDCDPAGRSCGAGLYCDVWSSICLVDSAAACGTGVDVAPIESGLDIGPGNFQFAELTTPVGNTLGLGDCGSDGDETAILFSVGSGDWDVVVTSADPFFVSVVDGYCALTSPTLCEEGVDEQVYTTISTSGETPKYLLIESAVAGSAATVSVTATRLAICGDGIVAGSEACDDNNTTSGDGCDAVCAVEQDYSCSGQPSVCQLP